MGLRSIMKYLALMKIGMNLAQRGIEWLEDAKDEDSPGGEEVTAEEYLGLIPIIEEAIVDGLGVAVKVKVIPAEIE